MTALRGRRGRTAWLPLMAFLQCCAFAVQAGSLATGIAQRNEGQVTLSIATLRDARDRATSEAARMRASAELGASLIQARQLEAAEQALGPAHAHFTGPERGRVALDLGNLAVLQGKPETALLFYDEAVALGHRQPPIAVAAKLNRARILAPAARPAALAELESELAAQPPSPTRAGWQINLGQQLRQLGTTQRAFAQLEAARRWAASAGEGQAPLLADALDALAQLYEDQGRREESLALTRQAMDALDSRPPGATGPLWIQLEWRHARLSKALGGQAASLAAYRRAVRRIEAVRQDLPIADDHGGSSFRGTLQPVYLGLVEALLDAAAGGTQPAARLREAIDTIELLRQSELQDYLGDRCDVDAVKGGQATVIPPGTAVLYPVLLGDRLELLMETADGITQRRSGASGRRVMALAGTFADELRHRRYGFMEPARELYDAVLRPLEPDFAAQNVHTLVVSPDGPLRLVAMGAFHDGQRFAIEKFAMATATGMSMTNTSRPTRQAAAQRSMLIAGVSVPGPVVDQLGPAAVANLLGLAAADDTPESVADSRSMLSGPATAALRSNDPRERSDALRQALKLPGVEQEVDAIGSTMRSRLLLNAAFTLERFRRAARAGEHSILHVASHGVFGGSADKSFILAYDALLTLDGLQDLLRSDAFRRRPIELLSLSACETAEGDDRSPLGISGAAMKARAQAVLGSLWPVADEAAVPLMADFYRGLGGVDGADRTKAQALQRSQIALLRTPRYAHPFFWAPFILIGNWL